LSQTSFGNAALAHLDYHYFSALLGVHITGV
jgi:hypothetical protein